jgi:hypothetical protein
MKGFNDKNGFVDWELIDIILNNYSSLVKDYKRVMKKSYGTFYGNDWKIAVAKLIYNMDKIVYSNDKRRK